MREPERETTLVGGKMLGLKRRLIRMMGWNVMGPSGRSKVGESLFGCRSGEGLFWLCC